ncbi:flagellin [Halomonas sp. R1t8]|jgi:flagellin|uniref:flagellin N-terminal helical domain-containing protein n=1 Tax=unclassified Halomonas TaxID=2609666 RepID=UPI0020A080EB|nr:MULTISPECIES: flagellin [unclassified Halomonas]MCP1305486.1 flagellin [Halomonas sp. R1t8]MCP1331972.1 flagellin [Halomonas sp. R1t4]
MSVINTNITSMIGQSNLQKSQSALQTSMERLSSGLRINSAKDDAAGQAIANRMTAQITGLSQSQRNANDGISVAQTAEGALNQINDNVQRIRELTVQAQNGTNSPDDLQSIQDEINQRTSEIDRISGETNFNGVKVLAEDQSIAIQVGANDGESISVNLKEMTTETLGLSDLDVTSLPKTVTASDLATSGGTTLAIEASGGGAMAGASVVQVASGAGTVEYIRDASGAYFEATAVDSGGTVTVTQGAAVDAEAASAAGLTPLADIDAALKNVDSLRSDLGAVQNRFESAIDNLNTNETNLSAARSRIEDADYAVEVANMTRAQILQQAGTSVLAQANQIPQNVLSLLG